MSALGQLGVDVAFFASWLVVTTLLGAATSGVLWTWLSARNLETLKTQLRSEAAGSIERLKDELKNSTNSQLERLKSDLRQNEDAARTRNRWLHEKRAQVIVELFGSIVDLETASIALTTPIHIGPNDPESLAKAREERWRSVNRAGNAYRKRYPKDVIFFDEAISKQLNNLDDLFWAKYVSVSVFELDPRSEADYDRWRKTADHSVIQQAIRELKAALQQLMGVELAGQA